jgi:hypothetical protein
VAQSWKNLQFTRPWLPAKPPRGKPRGAAGEDADIGPGIGKTGVLTRELPRPLLPRRRPDHDRKVRAKCRQRFCRRQPNAIGGTRVLVVHGTAIHATAGEGTGSSFDVIDSAAREESASMRNKNLRKEARERMQDILADTKKRGPSSRVLEEVIRQAPSEYVTVGWLISILHRDSFGIVMLCLGLLATTPVGSTVPGLILAVMAVQLICISRNSI